MAPRSRKSSTATRSPTKTPTKATPLSAKARGKRKAVESDQDGAEEGPASSPTAKRRKPQRASLSRATRHAVAEARSSSDSSGTEDSSSADDDEEDGNEGETAAEKLARKAEALVAREDGKEGFIRETSADAYFRAQARPAKTSTNRLSQRGGDSAWEPFTPQSYLDALASWESSSKGKAQVGKRATLAGTYERRFAQWYAELCQGFSVILHGTGSKRELLNRFVKTHLARDGHVVLVNGFHVGTTIVDVLDALDRLVSPSTATSSKSRSRILPSIEALEARAHQLSTHFARHADFAPRSTRTSKPVYLVLHNMDGPVLRTQRAQAALSILACQPGIRLITTLDHVHANLIFPSALASARSDPDSEQAGGSRGYNFIYHHVPTFAPYTVETLLDGTMSRLFPPPLFPPTVGPSSAVAGGRSSGLASPKAVLHVLASLTGKAKRVFKLLAHRQVDGYSSVPVEHRASLAEKLAGSVTGDDGVGLASPGVAVSWRYLFEAAKGLLLVTQESQLRAHLAEFRDHAIVMSANEAPERMDGVEMAGEDEEGDEEWLWVAMEKSALEDVLKRMDE